MSSLDCSIKVDFRILGDCRRPARELLLEAPKMGQTRCLVHLAKLLA